MCVEGYSANWADVWGICSWCETRTSGRTNDGNFLSWINFLCGALHSARPAYAHLFPKDYFVVSVFTRSVPPLLINNLSQTKHWLPMNTLFVLSFYFLCVCVCVFNILPKKFVGYFDIFFRHYCMAIVLLFGICEWHTTVRLNCKKQLFQEVLIRKALFNRVKLTKYLAF